MLITVTMMHPELNQTLELKREVRKEVKERGR